MSMFEEFKEFALKGSVVDLAVGVIIGNAFGRVVSALVDKILMPPLGMALSGMDFSQLSFVLKAPDAQGKGAVVIGYGEFLQVVVNFLIVAIALFVLIKGMNSLKRKEVAAQQQAPTPPLSEDILLLREIRDLLRR